MLLVGWELMVLREHLALPGPPEPQGLPVGLVLREPLARAVGLVHLALLEPRVLQGLREYSAQLEEELVRQVLKALPERRAELALPEVASEH